MKKYMESKTWKFWDGSYEKLVDYENNHPKKVFIKFGNALLKDMKNMLHYEIKTNISDVNKLPIYVETTFFINLSNKDYKLKIFTVENNSQQLYPCVLNSHLTNTDIEVFDIKDFEKKLLSEMNSEDFKKSIYNILRISFSKEEIEKRLN